MTIEELQKSLADEKAKTAELTKANESLTAQNQDLTQRLEESRQINTKLLLGGYSTSANDNNDDEDDEEELSLEETILDYLNNKEDK